MKRNLFFSILLGASCCHAAESDRVFFNGKDLSGWKAADMSYWSVKDGAIVGHADKAVPRNQFIWNDEKVADFYFSVDVKLLPDKRNAGIQFRSYPDGTDAFGYQADVGAGVWGGLYHEHGRKILDWRRLAKDAVKPGQWNRYEILAIGHCVWTAINGKLSVSVRDPQGELEGRIALQIHSGPAQTVHYRNPTLKHNPPVALAGMDEKQLRDALIDIKRPKEQAKIKRRFMEPEKKNKRKLVAPLPHFYNGKFKLEPNDVVAFLGSGNMVDRQKLAYLETLLSSQAKEKPVYFRNMSWQADTVFRQQRPRNFGSVTDELDRVGANLLVMEFGQTESLEGPEKLPAFIKAYNKLLDELSQHSRRVVLLTPMLFPRQKGAFQNDLSNNNESVRLYAKAIQQLAEERKLICVDLTTLDLGEKAWRNPVSLSDQGQVEVAQAIFSQLYPKEQSADIVDGKFADKKTEDLRQLILKKNELWFRHWRPSNWGFLYGNRSGVPSSRDHKDRNKRWFPDEVEGIIPVIEQLESKINP